MAARLLVAAWLLVAAAVAAGIGWIYAGDAPEPEAPAEPALVLALPPPPSPSAAPGPAGSPPPVAIPSPPPEPAPAAPEPTATAQTETAAPPVTPAAPSQAPAAEPPAAPEPAPPASTPAPPDASPQVAASPGAAQPRKPWQIQARPFTAPPERPRIALIIAGLGIGEAATVRAIEQLPADVTLAFAPFVENAAEWVRRGRADGHEVLLTLGMEPASFPQDDPGPKALLTSLASGENLSRLEWVLGQTNGNVGVVSAMGSRFLTSEEDLRPVLLELRDRGLLFIDGSTTSRSLAASLAAEIGLAGAVADRQIDSEPSRAAIDRRLRELEQIARETGTAVAVGRPYPVTIERVSEWAKELERRGIALAPISAVVERQAR